MHVLCLITRLISKAGSHHGLCVCRTLLSREHKRIRAEYEERVKQLEQERQGVEEERVQVSLHAAIEHVSGAACYMHISTVCERGAPHHGSL